MSNWIKVSERLPDKSMSCLVLMNKAENYGKEHVQIINYCRKEDYIFSEDEQYISSNCNAWERYSSYRDPSNECKRIFFKPKDEKNPYVNWLGIYGFWDWLPEPGAWAEDPWIETDLTYDVIAWMPLPDYDDILDKEE